MYRSNQPHRVKVRREKALAYWQAQLNQKTRSEKCEATPEYIKGQIATLETKLKG